MTEALANPAGQPARIELRSVSKSFPTRAGDRLALDDISLRVAAGETATVIGPTGCGKTTVLNLVAGFTLPTTGEVLAAGLPVSAPGPDRGFMFQRPNLLPWLTIAENVAFPCRHGRIGGATRSRAEIADAAAHYLESVGLHDAQKLFPHQLSGGMQSRAALDAQTRLSMQQLLRRVVKTDGTRTVLFITHDVEEALLISDHVFLMSAAPGRLLRQVSVPFRGDENYRDIVMRPEFNDLKHELIDQLERLVPA
jgi:NitT/TauT family transport system ATP-binding protein